MVEYNNSIALTETDDESSSGSSSSSTEQPRRRCNEECSSHLFFFLGGLFYVITGVWDVQYAKYYDDYYVGDDDYANDDDYADDDDNYFYNEIVIGSVSFSIYLLFYVLAASFYFVNAMLDFKMATRQKESSQVLGRQIIIHEAILLSSEQDIEENVKLVNKGTDFNKDTLSTSNQGVSDSMEENLKQKNWQSKREMNIWSFSSNFTLPQTVAIIFGIAAVCDIIGALLSDSFETSSNIVSNIANHLYLLEAILALYGGRCCCTFANECDSSSSSSHSFDAEFMYRFIDRLNKAGDFLFLIGSMIDVLTGYLYLSPKFESSVILSSWNLTSSCLWLLNAILYITADNLSQNKTFLRYAQKFNS